MGRADDLLGKGDQTEINESLSKQDSLRADQIRRIVREVRDGLDNLAKNKNARKLLNLDDSTFRETMKYDQAQLDKALALIDKLGT